MSPKYVRIRELASAPGRDGMLPVAPATLWRWVKRGEFPQPVRLSGGVTAWSVESVEQWRQQRQADGTPASGQRQAAGAASVVARRQKASEVGK